MNSTLVPTGSYQQYKEDTSTYMTWLSIMAQVCGYTLPPSADKHGKIKSESGSHQVAYKLPITKIIVQAQCITGAGTAQSQFPGGIKRIARRAIQVRKQFSERFTILGLSTELHLHLIDVLETSLAILSVSYVNTIPCMKPSFTNTHGSDQSMPKQSKDNEDMAECLGNQFAALQMEDLEDTESALVYLEQYCEAVSTTKLINKHVIEPEKERDTHAEMHLHMILFFDELQRIRSTIRDIWSNYKNHEIDLIPATMTTNAALALMVSL